MCDKICDLQTIIDDNKEILTDGTYVKMCELTQKIMDNQKTNCYTVEYLESYITKISGTYQVDFKPYKTIIKLSDETVKKLQTRITEEGIIKLCYHMLCEEFNNLKIVKQEINCDTICSDCSEHVEVEIEVKNNVLIKKITKC